MSKDPAMLFYTKDFLTGVALLNMKERGQYITLLCLQQQLGHMSLEQMQMAVGKLTPGILSKYVQDDQGLYYNVRADVEIGKRRKHCEKQKENIEKRWNKAPQTDTTVNTTDIPNAYHGITTVIPLANASNNTPSSSSKGWLEEQFETFWSIYPRKVGKQAAKKAFAKVPKSELPKLIPAVEAQKASRQWTRDGGQFVPYPATWLNQGRWDDEVDDAGGGSKEAQQLQDQYNEWRDFVNG